MYLQREPFSVTEPGLVVVSRSQQAPMPSSGGTTWQSTATLIRSARGGSVTKSTLQEWIRFVVILVNTSVSAATPPLAETAKYCGGASGFGTPPAVAKSSS